MEGYGPAIITTGENLFALFHSIPLSVMNSPGKGVSFFQTKNLLSPLFKGRERMAFCIESQEICEI
jgi:hypothetical protein